MQNMRMVGIDQEKVKEILDRLKDIRNDTWGVVQYYQKYSSGASVQYLVERAYERVVEKIEYITFDDFEE